VGYAGSAAAVVVASLVAEAARHLLGIVNISLIYLIVVVAVATLWGLWPALVASLTRTTFWRGVYADDPDLRSEFLAVCEVRR
jgi:K+-sensing histidine kinase KdpD